MFWLTWGSNLINLSKSRPTMEMLVYKTNNMNYKYTYNERMKNLEKIKFKAGRLVLKMIYFTYISNIFKAYIMELPIHVHVPLNSKLDSFPISEHRALQLREDKYCLKRVTTPFSPLRSILFHKTDPLVASSPEWWSEQSPRESCTPPMNQNLSRHRYELSTWQNSEKSCQA